MQGNSVALYLAAMGLLGIASALLLGLFTLIEIHRSTRDIHRTTETSLQGIRELIQMS